MTDTFFKGFAIVFLAYLIGILIGCANPVAPSGGPVDEDPPVLDTAASSPLLPVNFTERSITLTFDEFIQLNDPVNSILISPPLSKTPEYRVRGRRVVLEFDEEEELHPNTTYTINFSDAIRDITEGNVLENFLYAFSTGDFIDSLELSVKLIDAYTNEPVVGAMAMLHPTGSDSAMFVKKPLYFAVSGEDGIARLQYLRADSFQLYALKDENRNFLLDLVSEKVGMYPGEPVTVPYDGEPLSIRMYQRDERLFLSHRRWEDGGRLLLKYNRPPESMKIEFPQLDDTIRRTTYGDTLAFHFPSLPVTDTLLMTATSLPDTRDTVRIPPPRDREVKPLRMKSVQTGLKPGEWAVFKFNQLLTEVDTSLIQKRDTITETSSGLRNWVVSGDSLKLDLLLDEGDRGSWGFLPGAVEDIRNQRSDSLEMGFNRSTVGNFSRLTLSVEGLDTAYQYIFIMEGPRGDETARKIVRGVEGFIWELNNLRPNNYRLKVIEDINHNYRWDPGNILRRKEAERVSYHNITELRANWEFEQTVVPFED